MHSSFYPYSLIATASLAFLLAATALADPPRSQSRGDSSHGTLHNGVPLPLKTEAFRVLPITVKRGFYYGTTELIASLKQAAQKVRTLHPGSVLQFGNLSRPGGGDIPQSRSHNSGRDADMAFFFRDQQKKDVQPRTLLHVLKDGKTKDGKLHFDVARNWDLIHELVSNPDIHIQWIFAANWLRTPMLQYAKANGVPLRTRIRMETVLKQPSDSAPHNDHFHLRIYCSEEDRLQNGCIDYGTRWPWVPDHADKKRLLKIKWLNAALDKNASSSVRQNALTQLTSLRARNGIPRLLPLLQDKELGRSVRALITQTRAVEATPALLEQWSTADTLSEKTDLIETLARLKTSQAEGALVDCIQDAAIPLATRTRALDTLVSQKSRQAVPALISMLNNVEDPWQLAIHTALGRLTNHTLPLKAQWESWWSAHQGDSSLDWIAAGYTLWGCAMCHSGKWSVRVDALIDAITGPEHISWHAQHDLNNLTGNGTRTTSWTPVKSHKYWAKWWKGAQIRYGGQGE